MTFLTFCCLFCDILTYSLSEGAECLESHLQVIRNPWTNFVKNVRQMWKSAPCWWFCENFWFTASWKDCFGSPGGLDIKSLNCIQWNFRKLGNIAPCCEHFLLPPFRKGQKNFLGVQVLRDKNPWTVFCANSDNYQWWKVLWNVVILLKSFEKLRKVSKSVEKF